MIYYNTVDPIKKTKNIKIKAWVLMLMAVLISVAAVSIVSLVRMQALVRSETAERMLDAAYCAAGMTDGDVLAGVRDKASPGYTDICDKLAAIRDNTEFAHIYAVREEKEGSFVFTVDASLDEATVAGSRAYCTEALLKAAAGTPAACDKAYTDARGSFLSAYCPVFDSQGRVAGIIGIDLEAAALKLMIKDQLNKDLPLYLCIIFILMAAAAVFFYMLLKYIVDPLRHMVEDAKDHEKEAFTDFIANMSHELRTPINAMLGMNEMISRESEDESILQYSDRIRTAGGMLLGIISDVLDLSKLENGEIEIKSAGYKLSSVLHDLVSMTESMVEEKGLLLKVEVDKNIPDHLYGDADHIKQIITNILTNAVKYTEKGRVVLTVGYEEAEEEPDSIILKVSVRDTGVGIRQEDIPKIFTKFERIEEKRNRNIAGTGLGMSITQKLLDLMGSTLKIKSVYGLGSEFGFSLKQKVVSPEAIGDYEDAYKKYVKEAGKYKARLCAPDAQVLLVDDNSMNHVVFRGLVKKTLIVVDSAQNGDEGIELASGKKYDLIFLDHMMPGKDGIETLHELRRDPKTPNKHTPAVCLTANAVSGARERYISEGFDDYLSKPIDPKKLEDIMIRHLPKEKQKHASDPKEAADRNSGRVPDILKGLKTIDVAAGIKNSGSVDGYLSILKMFYDSVDEKTAELERLYSAGNIKDYAIRVHALKSTAKIIGAGAVGEAAQRLEDAGKAGDTGYIKAHHGQFINDYRDLKEQLSVLYQKDNAPIDNRPVCDESTMEMVYSEIRQAAEEKDDKKLGIIFDEMGDYRIPEAEEEFFNSLGALAEKKDHAAIIGMLTDRG